MNIRELRNTRRLQSLLRSGKSIELRYRTRVIGRITPESKSEKLKKIEWPDFEARRKKIFGDKVFPGADILIEERGRY